MAADPRTHLVQGDITRIAVDAIVVLFAGDARSELTDALART